MQLICEKQLGGQKAMKKNFITYMLTVTALTATISFGNINYLGVSNTAIASAATVTSLSNCTPKIAVQSRTASTVSLKTSCNTDVKGYKIYRATSPDGKYKCIGTTKSTTFVDKKAKAGETYCYKTRAIGTVKGASKTSKASKMAKVSPALDKTASIKVNGKSNTDLSLNWSKVDGSKNYNVYRASSKNGEYVYIGCTNTNSFIDTALKSGETYYYCIKATNAANGVKYYGSLSDIISGTTKPQTTVTPTPSVPAKPTATPTPTIPTKPTTPVTPTPAPSNDADDQNYDSSFGSQVLKLVNVERAKVGLNPLSMSQKLLAPANKRAVEIKTSFSHTRPNGTEWSTVLKEYNVSVQTAGENIAYGYNTPELVMNGWMNSPGHRANILNANYNNIGVGVYEVNGTVYCTQLFSN